jgi:hypothetical protein
MATRPLNSSNPQAIFIPKTAQQAFVEFQHACLDSFTHTFSLRHQFEEIDRAYYREKDLTVEEQRAVAAIRAGDANKFRNVTIPIVYPQVEEAVTYQTDVFLTGYPIFSFIAPPHQQDAALQMNAIIEENSISGGWVREFMMAFRDGFKYNLLAVETGWQYRTAPSFSTDLAQSQTRGIVAKDVLWGGNFVKRLDPYNLIYDRRYSPADVASRGEFAGYSELVSRVELKKRINDLQYKIVDNVIAALESPRPVIGDIGDDARGYYIPQFRKNAERSQSENIDGFDWLRWAGVSNKTHEFNYSNSYVWSVIYARILPSDFGLKVASPNHPQIWKLTYINNSVLICAERLENAHEHLPILLAQPHEDGAGIQSKSLAETAIPYQELSTAMMNSIVQARRRAISDRLLYNPSLVSKQHIESDSVSARIPVRPAAYATTLDKVVYPFPFRDDQSAMMMQQMPQIMGFADLATGQNRARRGQFQKGNKTLHEFQTVMDGSSGRDQLCAISLEAQLFTPLKRILKLNILQYQGVAKIFSKQLQTEVSVDPVALRKAALEFKVSDGLTPASKIINTDTLQVAFQTLASSPMLGSAYNVGPLFSYLMKTQHTDLTPFEKSQSQLTYEQAMQAWQMAAQQAAEKGTQFATPQPTPQQFGWNPDQPQQPSPKVPGSQE